MDDDLLAYLGISRLHATYADIVTRMAWDEMRDLVTADASFRFDLGGGQTVELTGPDALGEFGARATAGFRFYRYQPVNAVLTSCDAGGATGRCWALEVGIDRTSGDWHEVYGAYDDEYALDEGRWRYARRDFRVVQRRVS